MNFRRGYAVLLHAILNSVLDVRAIIKPAILQHVGNTPWGGVGGLCCYLMGVGHLLPKYRPMFKEGILENLDP